MIIADDHPVVRSSLRGALQGQPNMEVVGLAANGKEAVTLTRSLQPHVVLMDVQMPILDGIEATRLINIEWPHIKVIGISMNHTLYAARMMAAGAAVCLDKSCQAEELYNVILTWGQQAQCPPSPRVCEGFRDNRPQV